MIEELCVVAAAGLLLYAAWSDFLRWKIPNAVVLALIGTYAVMAVGRLATGQDPLAMSGLVGDLASGAFLFTLGFAFRRFRLMGAGDAKLFFPIGLFVGWSHLMVFGLALAVLAVLAAFMLRFAVPLQLQAFAPLARLDEIRRTGKVPYGVIMTAAALLALYTRYLP